MLSCVLALFLIQSGSRFDTELLGPTIIQITESTKDINRCNHSCNFCQSCVVDSYVWAESLKPSSLIFSVSYFVKGPRDTCDGCSKEASRFCAYIQPCSILHDFSHLITVCLGIHRGIMFHFLTCSVK